LGIEQSSYVPIRTSARKLLGTPEQSSYVPIRTPTKKLLGTPTPLDTSLYAIPEKNCGQQFDEIIVQDEECDPSSEKDSASAVH